MAQPGGSGWFRFIVGVVSIILSLFSLVPIFGPVCCAILPFVAPAGLVAGVVGVWQLRRSWRSWAFIRSLAGLVLCLMAILITIASYSVVVIIGGF